MRFGGLIAAIVFAAIAAVIVLRMSASDAPAPVATGSAAPPVQTENIYVAAQAIPIGSTITSEMVTSQPWPNNLMLEGFIKADGKNSVVGMVARAPFQQQEPIITSKVANASDPNFLAGALPKGMRVITIQTNEIEGLAGFVFPGDRVDVILTRDVDKWVGTPGVNGEPGQSVKEADAVTETLLTNVTVLAVDQRASGANATDKDGKLLVPHSVSLMVSPTDAQRLRLGARKGILTLALRSLQDRESADPLTLTGVTDISQYPDDAAANSQGGSGVLVIRGTESEKSKSLNGPAPMGLPAAMPTNPTPRMP